MDDWASNPRQKEKERTRQAKVAAFKTAYPKFQEALMVALKSGAGKYMAEFPEERIGVDASGDSVRVILETRTPPAGAVIKAGPENEEIQCEVQGRDGRQVWSESVIADRLGLRNSQLDQERTAEEIAKKILRSLI